MKKLRLWNKLVHASLTGLPNSTCPVGIVTSAAYGQRLGAIFPGYVLDTNLMHCMTDNCAAGMSP